MIVEAKSINEFTYLISTAIQLLRFRFFFGTTRQSDYTFAGLYEVCKNDILSHITNTLYKICTDKEH